MIGRLVLTAVYRAVTNIWFAIYSLLLSWRWLRADHAGLQEGLARLGLVQETALPKRPTLVYAEGVGECRAALPWLKAMQKNPDNRVVVVVLDKEAQTMMEKIGGGIPVVLLPWDIKVSMAWFFTTVNPQGVIIIERGIWPNFFHVLGQKKIPCMVASARLSERSFRFYKGLGKVFRHIIQPVALWGAQSEAIRQQYLDLGVSAENIHTWGNIKYALEGLSDVALSQAGERKKQWLAGQKGPILVGVSTHEGEEAILLESYKTLRKKMPHSKLVLIPRFITRTQSIMNLVKNSKLTATLHTQQGSPASDPVHIVDAIGQVMGYLAMADMAFIGGSLVERGGHNPLEAAKLGVPCLTGPHTKNFTSVWEDLAKLGAHKEVTSAADILQEVESMVADPHSTAQLSQRLEAYMNQQDAVLAKHDEGWQTLCVAANETQ
jgi:3-deoxy-D-manno-octulosonic-acid transferase